LRDYTYDTLPDSVRAAVPADTELTHAVGGALAGVFPVLWTAL
jgi:hypothetical protein